MMRFSFLLCLLLGAIACAHESAGSRVTYLGNSGVLITHGDLQIAFDPLFRNDFGIYQRVPDSLERQLMQGEVPFNSLDAVFVSHFHGDHFDPALMVDLLLQHPQLVLFAPAQAVEAMQEEADFSSVDTRIRTVALNVGDPAKVLSLGSMQVEALRIPHSGWPERMTEVENIAWRVSANGHASVIHLGDATTQVQAFADSAGFWAGEKSRLALTPYWFFLSSDGQTIVEQFIAACQFVGVHVPSEISDKADERPNALKSVQLFTVPGEILEIDRSQAYDCLGALAKSN